MNQDTFFDDLNEALRDAIRKPDRLAYFIRSQFGKRLNEIVSLEKDYNTVVASVVDTAEAEGWIDNLIKAAHFSVPGNVKLRALAQQVGLIPSTIVTVEQEAVVIQSNPFLDMSIWKNLLSEVELRVCRVTTPDKYGSGFLVGPDLIMTSYHVMESVIKDGNFDEVRFIFDHKKLANGVTSHGTGHRLAKQDWCVDFSPPSSIDQLSDTLGRVPHTNELDYVIVRTDKQPGNEEITGKGKPNARRRGWIDISEPAPRAHAGAGLIIAQYPVFEPSPGRRIPQPLMMSLDTQSVIELNKNATRIQYRTNTDQGASGAPCFTINWKLLALHRGGNAIRNDGIPFSAIQASLKKRDLIEMFVPFSNR